MIFKTLGTLDLVTVVLLAGAAIFPQKLIVYAGIYLIAKGLLFIAISMDIASFGDAISGALIILMVMGMDVPLLNTAVLIYLGQKTFFTFVKIGLESYSLYRFIRETRSPGNSGGAYYYLR